MKVATGGTTMKIVNGGKNMTNMTDRMFAKRLAKLNTMLFDCVVLAEDILNTEQAHYLKSLLDDSTDNKLKELQTLYNSYAQDGICDCDLHSATLSDITRLVEKLNINI